LDTATKASFGHRSNQSIVQPEMSPGNLSDRLRNLSPTYTQIAFLLVMATVFVVGLSKHWSPEVSVYFMHFNVALARVIIQALRNHCIVFFWINVFMYTGVWKI